MRTVRVILLWMFAVAVAVAQTPQWVKDFRDEAKVCHYELTQKSLKVLRETHRGNCVAYAKLAAWHALRAGVKCEFVRIDGGEKYTHLMLFVREPKGLWIVSNNDCYRAKEEWEFPLGFFGWDIISRWPATEEQLD